LRRKLAIRPYRKADFDAVTILWRLAREKSLPDHQRRMGYFFHEDRDFFRNYILPKDKIWVAVFGGERVAFMAMKEDFIDQLYVHPDHWRKGFGKALLDFAKKLAPSHLWLFTLQINVNARAFYEKNGFAAEKFGISPEPECEPDVEYHWRPAR
jgi:GNAT superfamily N-acetyltransferase